MVMPLIPIEKTPLPFAKTLAEGTGTEGGRRPTVVPAPSAASPELGDRPRRRNFPAAEKLRILREIDAAGPGGVGAILRREGIYSSMVTEWRRLRDAGAFEALKAVKRGPRPAPVFLPSVDEHARLRRENASLTLRLQRAEAIIDIQKKVASLLGLSMPSDGAS